MTLLQLKQQAAHLKESDRRELSEFLLKLGRTKPGFRGLGAAGKLRPR